MAICGAGGSWEIVRNPKPRGCVLEWHVAPKAWSKCHKTLIMRRGEPDTRGSWPAVINLGVHSVFMRPIHPGEFLCDELNVLGVSPTELARRVKVLAVAHIASRLCQGGGS